MSPMPFHCIECDKPTSNKSGLCDDCEAEIYNPALREGPMEERETHEYFEGTNVPVDEWDDIS